MQNNNQAYQTLNQYVINWLSIETNRDSIVDEYSFYLRLGVRPLENAIDILKSQDVEYLDWILIEILWKFFEKEGLIVEDVDDGGEYFHWIFKIDNLLVKYQYNRDSEESEISFVKKVIKIIEIESYE